MLLPQEVSKSRSEYYGAPVFVRTGAGPAQRFLRTPPKVHSALTPARQTIGPSRNKLERAHAKLVSELDGEYRKPQSDGRNVGLTPR